MTIEDKPDDECALCGNTVDEYLWCPCVAAREQVRLNKALGLQTGMPRGLAFHFKIAGVAAPAARPRVSKLATYYPPAYETWREIVKLEARQAAHDAGHGRSRPLSGPIAVHLVFYLPMAESELTLKRKPVTWHTARPDIDNLEKGITDGLSESWYDDDAQVAWAHSIKLRCGCADKLPAPMPHVLVTLCELKREASP